MKRWFKVGALVMVIALIVGTMGPIFAMTLEEMQQELDRINKEKQALQQEKKGIDREIKQLGLELDELNLELGQAQYLLDQLTRQIADQEAIIEIQEGNIEKKEQEIAETEAHLEEQMGHLEHRMRAMYKNGSVNYLEVLFSATSFSDFLSRLKFITTIIDSDAILINDVRETREILAKEKVELEAELVLLVQRKEKLEDDRNQAKEDERKVASLVANRKAKQRQLQRTAANLNSEIGGYSKKAAEFDQEIKRILDEQKWKEGESPDDFLWPVPVATTITSPFGWRTLWGKPDYHRGIDIAPSRTYWPPSPTYQGVPAYIVASASGTVVTSAYHSSYGWYVLIAHGGGYATLYAHQHRKPMVNVGDFVSRGQKIGIVGSTGNSSGPHLHFEVRINGNYVNPKHYIDK